MKKLVIVWLCVLTVVMGLWQMGTKEFIKKTVNDELISNYRIMTFRESMTVIKEIIEKEKPEYIGEYYHWGENVKGWFKFKEADIIDGVNGYIKLQHPIFGKYAYRWVEEKNLFYYSDIYKYMKVEIEGRYSEWVGNVD